MPVSLWQLALYLTHYIRPIQLKQGDPMVYVRAGEVLAYFHAHGYAPLILPNSLPCSLHLHVLGSS